ncbi:hypothetical protein ACFYRL_36305 [Streptomyces goshikiensis]|uniref:hypothetical protein n=1 Tax=Streptomyces goshikiensis TaxID=1942 RepID=UPI0036D11EBB
MTRRRSAFGEVPHRLQGKQVRDPATGREGRLMAVLEEPLGVVDGRHRYAETAYVRGVDAREFTASPTTLIEAEGP